MRRNIVGVVVRWVEGWIEVVAGRDLVRELEL